MLIARNLLEPRFKHLYLLHTNLLLLLLHLKIALSAYLLIAELSCSYRITTSC